MSSSLSDCVNVIAGLCRVEYHMGFYLQSSIPHVKRLIRYKIKGMRMKYEILGVEIYVQ